MRLYINNKNQIRTGIYSIEVMKFLDAAMVQSFYSRSHACVCTKPTSPYNMHHILIDDNAEGYIDLNVNRITFKTNLTLEILKDIVSLTIKIADNTILNDEYKSNVKYHREELILRKGSSALKSLLNVWNDEYADKDLKVVGSMPDPFKLQQLQKLLKMYHKIYDNNSYVTSEEHDKLNRICKQIVAFYSTFDEVIDQFNF